MKVTLVGADLAVYLFLDEKTKPLNANLGTGGWI